MISLHPHQSQLLADNPSKHGIFFKGGLGKTITAIYLANRNLSSLIVVCPKAGGLKEMWERELKAHAKPSLKYEVWTKEQFKINIKEIAPTDGIIIDESHTTCGISPTGKSSQVFKAVHWYIRTHNIAHVWPLTATPYTSSVMSVYAVARLLGHEWDFWKFRRKFFVDIPMGGRTIPRQRTGIEKEVATLVRSIGTVVDMAEVVVVPPQHHLPEYLDLTPPQQKAMTLIDADTFMGRFTRQHQIENGYVNNGEYAPTPIEYFDNLKEKRIVELANTHKKMVIFARYRHQLDRYRMILELKGHTTLILNGDTPDQDSVIQHANASSQVILLVQSECSSGYELPTFNVTVYASLSWSCVHYLQSTWRTLRINALHENTYYYLITNGVDRDIYETIKRGEDFSTAIYERTVEN